MNPPKVYDETMPNNHKTRRITKIVQSTIDLPSYPVHKDRWTPCRSCRLFAACTSKKNVLAQPAHTDLHRSAAAIGTAISFLAHANRE